MKTHTCDRCGESIPRGRTNWRARGTAFNGEPGDQPARLRELDFDLCGDCKAEFRAWLAAGDQTEPQPSAHEKAPT